MAEDSAGDAPAPGVTWSRSNLFRHVYCQVFRARLTAGDVTLTVSTITDQFGLVRTEAIEDQVAIVMSWSELKMLTQHLETLVAAIEQDIGPIPVPHAFRPTVDAQLVAVRTLDMSKPSEPAKPE
jgi:hypothetical protein